MQRQKETCGFSVLRLDYWTDENGLRSGDDYKFFISNMLI